jgi:hypothetical protein
MTMIHVFGLALFAVLCIGVVYAGASQNGAGRWAMFAPRRRIPYGVRRLRSSFLILPKTIKGERRWWSREQWIEEYCEVWIPIQWINPR